MVRRSSGEMDARHISGEARKTFSLRTSELQPEADRDWPVSLAEWLPDQFIRLTRNDDYWQSKSQYKELYFRTIPPDVLTMELEFQAGALDWYDAQPHQAERYRKNPAYHVVPNGEGSYSYIGYNMRRPLFQDVRVRRALGMAIDVNSIIRYVLYGQGRRATGPYYSNTPYNDPQVTPFALRSSGRGRALGPGRLDQERPQGCWRRDGKSLQFTLVTNNGSPAAQGHHDQRARGLAQDRVDCKIQAFEWSVFIEDFVNKDNFDALVLGWVGGDNNPDKFQVWHSSQTESLRAEPRRLPEQGGPDALNRAHPHRVRPGRASPAEPSTASADRRRSTVYLLDRVAQAGRARQAHRARHQEPRRPGKTVRKIETAPSGSIDQYFTEWRKLSSEPEYSSQ